MVSGFQAIPSELSQAARQFKVFLSKVTPNKSAEAKRMGIRPPTITGWCNSTQYNPQMPAAFIPFHTEAVKILDMLARAIDCQVVPMQPYDDLDGDLSDEILSCVHDLGNISGRVQIAMQDVVTPGKVDTDEAHALLDQVRQLQNDVRKMVVELSSIIAGTNP